MPQGGRRARGRAKSGAKARARQLRVNVDRVSFGKRARGRAMKRAKRAAAVRHAVRGVMHLHKAARLSGRKRKGILGPYPPIGEGLGLI